MFAGPASTAQLFNTESKFSPLVVISGRVGSETPIICDYSLLRGVIVEKTMLGVDHVERLLPIGASMTVIGQVVKDDTEIIKVQHPYEGHLFYVGRLTVDELIADLGMTAWVLSDGLKRSGQDVKGSYGKAENESDRATKDRQMLGLRVIGLAGI
ncbi:hypothetical protein QYF36_015046 [Acer negundo]|nr:hypothetical protein QYF36_015046 [Acer negundo]